MQVAKKAYDEDDGDCGCKAAVIVAITVSRDNLSFVRTAVAWVASSVRSSGVSTFEVLITTGMPLVIELALS